MPASVTELADTPGGNAFGSPQAIGEVFLTDYVLVFEVTGLVLVVAAIGGIVLGLTGRARRARMQLLMQTRSADQYKRLHARREAELRAERGEEPRR
jgi:hypothetical protein